MLEHEPKVALKAEFWRERSTLAMQKVVDWLSVAVTIDGETLSRYAVEVAGTAQENEDLQRAIRSIGECSFVHRASDGYYIPDAVALYFADRFRSQRFEEFYSVNAYLAAWETQRVDAPVEIARADIHDDAWARSARIGFYYCAIDPARAERQFANSFDTAAPSEAIQARAWLVRLGLRQEYLLGSASRTVMFLRAFSAYVGGQRGKAARGFEEIALSESAVDDSYSAIALHLLAVLQVEGRDRTEDLRRSVWLSEALDLHVNEVMARNSLVYSLLQEGHRPQAYSLAVVNLAKARAMGDLSLIGFCLVAVAASGSADLAGTSENLMSSEEILPALREALEIAAIIGDIETGALAVNSIIAAHVHDGNLDLGLRAARDWFGAAISRFERPDAARRIGQTLGTLRSRTMSASQRMELEDLRAWLDRW